jgi:hypothetical protein
MTDEKKPGHHERGYRRLRVYSDRLSHARCKGHLPARALMSRTHASTSDSAALTLLKGQLGAEHCVTLLRVAWPDVPGRETEPHVFNIDDLRPAD